MPRLKVRRLLPQLLLSPLLLAVQCLRLSPWLLPRPVYRCCRYIYCYGYYLCLHPDFDHAAIHRQAKASTAEPEEGTDEEIMSIYKDKSPVPRPSRRSDAHSAKWSTRKRWSVAVAIFIAIGLTVTIILLFTLPDALPGDIPGPGGHDDGGGTSPTASATPKAPTWTEGYPNPENMVEDSPIPNNDIYQTLDPTIMRRASDGRVFLFTTGGPNGTSWEAPSLHGPWTRTSENLFGEGGGAPSLHQIGNEYYMVHNSHIYNYTANGIENKAATKHHHSASVVVQSSSTLDPGSWTNHGRLNITWSMRYNILDPAILSATDVGEVNAENENHHLLMFGSYQTGLFHIPLADPPVELAAGAMENLRHIEQNTTVYGNAKDRTEAAYPYRRGKWTYMFFSAGRCCRNKDSKEWPAQGEEYHMLVCRTDKDPFLVGRPDADTGEKSAGDYFDRQGRNCRTENGGTDVLSSHGEVYAPGGGGVYDDPDEGLVMYYHYLHRNNGAKDPTKGYYFGWNKLRFDDDDWPELYV